MSGSVTQSQDLGSVFYCSFSFACRPYVLFGVLLLILLHNIKVVAWYIGVVYDKLSNQHSYPLASLFLDG